MQLRVGQTHISKNSKYLQGNYSRCSANLNMGEEWNITEI